MVKIVVCNGFPGSGKTTFQNFCKSYCNDNEVPGWSFERKLNVDIVSTVDFVKMVAMYCGWDKTKTLKNRKFLSDLKDLLTEWDDVPYKKIKQHADMLTRESGDWILFVDCREPAEIQKLKNRLNAITLLIRRPDVEDEETSNHADANVMNYNYDLTIWNNSDIIDLENKAKNFIEIMKGAPHYEYDD